jgi:hypothetical protein
LGLETYTNKLIEQHRKDKNQRPDFILDNYAIEVTRANYGQTQEDSWGRSYEEYLKNLKSQNFDLDQNCYQIMSCRSGLEAKFQGNKNDQSHLNNSVLLLNEILLKNQRLMALDPILRYRFYLFSINFIKKNLEIFYTIIKLLDDVIKDYNKYCIEYANASEKVVENFIKNNLLMERNNITINTITDKQFYVIVDKLVEEELKTINQKLKNKCTDLVHDCITAQHEENIMQEIINATQNKIKNYNSNVPTAKGNGLGNTILFVDVTDPHHFFFEKYEESYRDKILQKLNLSLVEKSNYFNRIILSSTSNKPCFYTIYYKDDKWQLYR